MQLEELKWNQFSAIHLGCKIRIYTIFGYPITHIGKWKSHSMTASYRIRTNKNSNLNQQHTYLMNMKTVLSHIFFLDKASAISPTPLSIWVTIAAYCRFALSPICWFLFWTEKWKFLEKWTFETTVIISKMKVSQT